MIIHKIQRWASRSKVLVNVAVKLRNQCNVIIGLSVANDHIFSKTGEADFLLKHKGTIKYFIDVGANKGDWTEEIIKLNPDFRKGILLEPNPDCFKTLSDKFGEHSKIQILPLACSDYSGTASFFAEKGGGETSSLSNAGTYNATKIEVAVSTIDEIMVHQGIDEIDYLKIDVEGFDLHVLKGSKHTLSEKKVRIIQFEYNKTWRDNGSTLAYAFSYLQSFGYKTYCLTSSGFTAFPYQSLSY